MHFRGDRRECWNMGENEANLELNMLARHNTIKMHNKIME